MRTRRTATVGELRLAVDRLPKATKVAMLEGIRANQIVAGAYTYGDGICPMLAAHRAGGRTSDISFAKAWDRFAYRGARVRLARRATERELLILRTHLEASLLEEDWPALDSSVAEHGGAIARPEPCRGDAEPDVDYEHALSRLESQRAAVRDRRPIELIVEGARRPASHADGVPLSRR